MKKIFPSPVSIQTLFGFHAIRVRYKTAPETILEVYFDQTRRDQRMRDFLQKLEGASLRLIESDDDALHKICGTSNHQGVVARVKPLQLSRSLDGTLETFAASELMLLVLDGVTDPHNLGACLRVADGAGAQAVIAPKDHAVGINATVSKVASGAAETVPYFMVTNLARTLNELKERDIQIIGTSDNAQKSIFDLDLTGPVAWVFGAEGQGMRQLTRKTCDQLVYLPMRGAVESLNVSVSSAICLYETLRQRQSPG